jgi:hypothetical protein
MWEWDVSLKCGGAVRQEVNGGNESWVLKRGGSGKQHVDMA